MNWPIISALVQKDIILFFRDKFFGAMTVFGLVLYIVFYLVMPKKVDETIKIAVHAPDMLLSLLEDKQPQAVVFHKIDSEESLKQAVLAKKFQFGFSIAEDFQTAVLAGSKPKITVYLSSELPAEFKNMYPALLGEMFSFGNPQNIEFVETVLGPDMGGKQIPYRKRLLPMFVFFILFMEIFGLANLITSEIESDTARALLVTKMKVEDLFFAKGLTGIFLAFPQAALFLLVSGNLSHNVMLILLTIFLGTTLLTGISFMIASVAKDMMSVIGWSTLLILIMIIPAVGILFPAFLSGWVKIIPSYFLMATIHKVVNFGIGWSGNSANVLVLAGFTLIFGTLGIVTLRRKMI